MSVWGTVFSIAFFSQSVASFDLYTLAESTLIMTMKFSKALGETFSNPKHFILFALNTRQIQLC